MSDDLERACREGLESLDAVIHKHADPAHDPVAGATRGAVRMRDALIGRQRRGEDVAHLLRDANVLVSELVAGEFPVSGFRIKRIQQARELYVKVIDGIRAA